MKQYTPAWPHGKITEIFADIFMVTGSNKTNFGEFDLEFSRNMTIIREGKDLTLINAVRLDDAGLAKLESLGKIKHILRLGAFHGRDDAFYIDTFGTEFWALPNAVLEYGETIDHELCVGGSLPISRSNLFVFNTAKYPECILQLNRDGGILVACDCLQNLSGPDEYFNADAIRHFSEEGMFQPANMGAIWCKVCKPQASDINRLQKLSFKHLLSAHGDPLMDTAGSQFAETFERVLAEI